MRKEFYRMETETEKDYLTRAAGIIASFREGKPLADGTILKQELTAEEEKELMEYIFTFILPTMNRVVDCESARVGLKEEAQETYRSMVYETVLVEFHKYNNPDYMNREGMEFTFDTFVKNRTQSCMREAVAEERGLCINRGRMLHKMIKIKNVILSDG